MALRARSINIKRRVRLVVVDLFFQGRPVVRADQAHQPVRHGGARAVLLQRAGAQRDVGEERRVPDLTGREERPFVQLVVQDQAPADAGAAPGDSQKGEPWDSVGDGVPDS